MAESIEPGTATAEAATAATSQEAETASAVAAVATQASLARSSEQAGRHGGWLVRPLSGRKQSLLLGPAAAELVLNSVVNNPIIAGLLSPGAFAGPRSLLCSSSGTVTVMLQPASQMAAGGTAAAFLTVGHQWSVGLVSTDIAPRWAAGLGVADFETGGCAVALANGVISLRGHHKRAGAGAGAGTGAGAGSRQRGLGAEKEGVNLGHLSNKPDPDGDSGHPGEYRVGKRYRCALPDDESSRDGSKICVHGGGVVDGEHWSCCGSKSRDAPPCQRGADVGSGAGASPTASCSLDMISASPAGNGDSTTEAGLFLVVRGFSESPRTRRALTVSWLEKAIIIPCSLSINLLHLNWLK